MSELKKVVTVSDRAAKSLIKATGELGKIADTLGVFAASAEALTVEIEGKQTDLDNITAKTKIAEREAAVELGLRVKENEEKVLDSLLKGRGLSKITTGEVADLVRDLEASNAGNAEDTVKAVKTAESLLHARYGGELKTVEANHKVAVAQKDADIGAKDMQIGFMRTQIKTLEDTANAERQARISIASSEAQKQGVTVNTSSK